MNTRVHKSVLHDISKEKLQFFIINNCLCYILLSFPQFNGKKIEKKKFKV